MARQQYFQPSPPSYISNLQTGNNGFVFGVSLHARPSCFQLNQTLVTKEPGCTRPLRIELPGNGCKVSTADQLLKRQTNDSISKASANARESIL